jgi:hypothetical protein
MGSQEIIKIEDVHLKYTHEMELKIQFRNIGRDNNLTKTLSRKHQSQS